MKLNFASFHEDQIAPSRSHSSPPAAAFSMWFSPGQCWSRRNSHPHRPWLVANWSPHQKSYLAQTTHNWNLWNVLVPPGLLTFSCPPHHTWGAGSERSFPRTCFFGLCFSIYCPGSQPTPGPWPRVSSELFSAATFKQRLLAIGNHWVNGAPLRHPVTPASISWDFWTDDDARQE